MGYLLPYHIQETLAAWWYYDLGAGIGNKNLTIQFQDNTVTDGDFRILTSDDPDFPTNDFQNVRIIGKGETVNFTSRGRYIIIGSTNLLQTVEAQQPYLPEGKPVCVKLHDQGNPNNTYTQIKRNKDGNVRPPGQGGVVQGGTVQGGTVQGGNVQGGTVQGGTVQPSPSCPLGYKEEILYGCSTTYNDVDTDGDIEVPDWTKYTSPPSTAGPTNGFTVNKQYTFSNLRQNGYAIRLMFSDDKVPNRLTTWKSLEFIVEPNETLTFTAPARWLFLAEVGVPRVETNLWEPDGHKVCIAINEVPAPPPADPQPPLNCPIGYKQEKLYAADIPYNDENTHGDVDVPNWGIYTSVSSIGPIGGLEVGRFYAVTNHRDTPYTIRLCFTEESRLNNRTVYTNLEHVIPPGDRVTFVAPSKWCYLAEVDAPINESATWAPDGYKYLFDGR